MAGTHDPLRLVIELDRGPEPIRGTVSEEGGRPREYVGWLALISALDELRQQPADQEES